MLNIGVWVNVFVYVSVMSKWDMRLRTNKTSEVFYSYFYIFQQKVLVMISIIRSQDLHKIFHIYINCKHKQLWKYVFLLFTALHFLLYSKLCFRMNYQKLNEKFQIDSYISKMQKNSIMSFINITFCHKRELYYG